MTAHVPEGMSSTDVFEALYINANVSGMGRFSPSAGEPAGSPWNAIQIYKKYCRNGDCEYVRGKCMRVSFRKFPELNVIDYDKLYGEGSAQKAIDTYQKTMGKSKKKYDLNCEPCTYFTSYWKQRTPEHQRKDLDEMFSRCQSLEESEERAVEQISETDSNWVLNECQAKYSLISFPNGYLGFDYRSCHEALGHFKLLLQNRMHEETTVEGLSICRYNRFLPSLKRCQKQCSEVSLDTARKILESQIPKG